MYRERVCGVHIVLAPPFTKYVSVSRHEAAELPTCGDSNLSSHSRSRRAGERRGGSDRPWVTVSSVIASVMLSCRSGGTWRAKEIEEEKLAEEEELKKEAEVRVSAARGRCVMLRCLLPSYASPSRARASNTHPPPCRITRSEKKSFGRRGSRL